MSQNTILSENAKPDSSLRVWKATYIKQQMERQRAAEDARLAYLLKEQEVIEGLNEAIDDSMWQTEGVRKYNQEFQEQINRQIYGAHGITEDKLAGMREYKGALYKGAAAVMFLLSLALTVLCGVMYGFQSQVCLLMFAYMAMEGALLSGEEKRRFVLNFICKVLYMLVFPTMLVMFVCFGMEYKAYEWFLPYAVILGVFVTVAGMLSYFLYAPYRQDRKRMQEARKHIREIERSVGKEIRKEQKGREKQKRGFRKLLKHNKDTDQNVSDAEEDREEKPPVEEQPQ